MEPIVENYNNQNAELWDTIPVDTVHWEKREWKDPNSQMIGEFALRLCLLVTSKATPWKSHQYELNKSNRHAKVDRWKTTQPQPYTKNYRQLRNVESGRHSLPEERAHQLVIQYQMVSPANMHRWVNIIQAEWVIISNIHSQTHTHTHFM